MAIFKTLSVIGVVVDEACLFTSSLVASAPIRHLNLVMLVQIKLKVDKLLRPDDRSAETAVQHRFLL